PGVDELLRKSHEIAPLVREVYEVAAEARRSVVDATLYASEVRHEFEIRVGVIEELVYVAGIEGVERFAHKLHVLLRHRYSASPTAFRASSRERNHTTRTISLSRTVQTPTSVRVAVTPLALPRPRCVATEITEAPVSINSSYLYSSLAQAS